MQPDKRKASRVFLILGIVFLTIGMATDNTAFSWISVAFIVISLIAGGRWMKPRKRDS